MGTHECICCLRRGLLLRWGLPGRFRLEAGHSEQAARFRLALHVLSLSKDARNDIVGTDEWKGGYA